jgi:hypothetical protein
MAAPTAIVDHGTVPSTAFTVADEGDLLMESVSYTATRREQRFTKAGQITGLRLDQPEMTVSFSGKITGTGTLDSSAVIQEHGAAVTTDFANFATGTGTVHGHLASDGVVVFMNPVRTVNEDEASMTFDLMHFPHMT